VADLSPAEPVVLGPREVEVQDAFTQMTDLEFLVSIKSYIEDMEEVVDGEWGDCRSLAALVIAGLMPQPIYSEVISRIKLLTLNKEENTND
jgi:hypothetical protein